MFEFEVKEQRVVLSFIEAKGSLRFDGLPAISQLQAVITFENGQSSQLVILEISHG